MGRRVPRRRRRGRGRPETGPTRTVAAALALATALMAWPAVPAAGVVPSEPPLLKGTKETNSRTRTGPFAARGWTWARKTPGPSAADLALRAARDQLGKPYRWAGVGPNGFDCSGLVQFAYRHAGIALPHNSRAQWGHVKRVGLAEMRPGDLVFSGGRRIGHVGLYIGDGKMIHSPHSGRRVEVAPLRRNLIGAGRPV